MINKENTIETMRSKIDLLVKPLNPLSRDPMIDPANLRH